MVELIALLHDSCGPYVSLFALGALSAVILLATGKFFSTKREDAIRYTVSVPEQLRAGYWENQTVEQQAQQEDIVGCRESSWEAINAKM